MLLEFFFDSRVKVFDSENIYVFECVGIEYYPEKYEIRKMDYNRYYKSKREDAIILFKKMRDNFDKIAGLIFMGSAGERIIEEKKEYQHLELE